MIPPGPYHDFTSHMSQTRFTEIKGYFHVSPLDLPKVLPGRRWLLYGKVDLVLTQLEEASQQYRSHGSLIRYVLE